MTEIQKLTIERIYIVRSPSTDKGILLVVAKSCADYMKADSTIKSKVKHLINCVYGGNK